MLSRLIKNNEFAKNVLTVMTGTILAQAIPIAILPILTRIFTPEDFGLLALYGAFVAILGVVATGRYEIAIMLPKQDDDAKILLQISVLIALVISLLFLPVVFFLNVQVASFLGNPDIANWLYLVPVSVLVTGVYQALTYWNNRKKNFKNASVSRVNQSFFQAGSQISFGFLKFSGGLILGQFVGMLSSVIYLLRKDNSFKYILKKNDKHKVKAQLTTYQKFPKYGVFGGLCDALAVQMPVLMLTKFYSDTVVGMFSLTFRVLNMPTSIISSAISQVLFQKVVEISHETPHKLKGYILKIFLLLFFVYLPAIPILYVWGESLFAFVFGDEWRQAGVYSSYLVIAVAIRFAVSPLSAVLGLEQNIKKGVFWQVLYVCTITSTLFLCSALPVEEFIAAFVIHELILYLLYLMLILKGSKAIV